MWQGDARPLLPGSNLTVSALSAAFLSVLGG
jgi:hypothetical protein